MKDINDYLRDHPIAAKSPADVNEERAADTPDGEPASGSRAYTVTDNATGEIVRCAFVLRPDIDDAAINAIRAYAHACGNRKLAERLEDWVCGIIRRKYCVKVRKEERDAD